MSANFVMVSPRTQRGAVAGPVGSHTSCWTSLVEVKGSSASAAAQETKEPLSVFLFAPATTHCTCASY